VVGDAAASVGAAVGADSVVEGAAPQAATTETKATPSIISNHRFIYRSFQI
jgi:hypothetical protein